MAVRGLYASVGRCITSECDLFLVFFLSFLAYCNSLCCGFVFDDSSAVKENQDLRPSVPWFRLFMNDFWGTPMNQERSHKSYRPVTVLSFRLNYMVHGLHPFGYHLVNVILHCVVSVLFFKLCQKFLTRRGSMISSLHFAFHPIHTEAVTGVVGRAELLSATIFLLVIFLYEHFRLLDRWTHWLGMVLVCSLLVGGTLCKEQCITVVAVLMSMELFKAYRTSFYAQLRPRKQLLGSDHCQQGQTETFEDHEGCSTFRAFWSHFISFFRSCRFRSIIVLSFVSLGILYMRGVIMDWKLPHFTEFDNPAAYSPPLVRRLTHLYLIPVNLWLLLFPAGLCADWTLGSIRLIDYLADPRNILTVVAFGVLLCIFILSVHPRVSQSDSMTLFMSLCLLTFPFIPASNLFFPVGFVIAERVLYTCSFGFSLFFGLGYDRLSDYSCANLSKKCGYWKSKQRQPWLAVRNFFPNLLAAIVLISFASKTVRRNMDWVDEYSLFSSALKVNPNNAKMWNNVGHSLEAIGDFRHALGYFRTAVRVQPNDIGARINVGRTLVNMNKLNEAEEAYLGALDYFPKPRKGQTYFTRVAPKDLMVFINLANLYLNKTPPQLEDAARLLKRAISLRSDFVDAYQNYGSVLIKQGKLSEAEAAYRTAIGLQDKNPDLVYNLGVVLLETGRVSEGLEYFNRALVLKPDHLPSTFALASALTDVKDVTKRHQGKMLLEKLISFGYELAKVHFALGMLETDERNFVKAVEHYRNVIRVLDIENEEFICFLEKLEACWLP